ncbi:MAG: hypothetical protein JSS72_06405 [Armatimonadetes bacterium]|nr:hypothetical protein [Armatimonadota bacterium]
MSLGEVSRSESIGLDWVSASDLRNWCEGEPALDWLNLYGKANGYVKDSERPDYRPETDMSVFIREKGQAFEAAVLELISQKITVESAYQREGEAERRQDEAYERTLELMQAGVDAIYQPVVRNHELALWGKPDLLIRSDRLDLLIENPPLGAHEAAIGAPAIGHRDFHYVVVDIKFKAFTLAARGGLGAGTLTKQVQVAVYGSALGEMQGYMPPKAFLLGRCVDEHNGKGENRSCFGRLAPVDVAAVLPKVLEAAEWARRVRREGHAWDIANTTIPEMQLNLSNAQDSPWHLAKKELAAKLKPLTALWQVSPTKAAPLFEAGVYRWDHPSLSADRFTALAEGYREKLGHILAAQRPGFTTTPPHQVDADVEVWGQPKGVEFYVDFETVSDLDDPFDSLPEKGGSPRIFMVGCGHIEDGEWRFSIFTADAMTDDEERRVLCEWLEHMEAVRRRLAPEVERPLVFHWSHAENSFLTTAYNSAVNRLSGDWPEVHWYDLLTKVVKAQPFVANGAMAFGLKAVAKAMYALGLISTKWEDGPLDGLAAMVGAWSCAAEALRRGVGMTKVPLMREIAAYNEVDCKVMWEILSYLRGTGGTS